MGPPVRIALDREGNDTVEVPRGTTSVETTYIGAPPPAAPLPNVEPAAPAWGRELDHLDAFRERVFMSEAAKGRREGIRFLADLTRIALASSRAKQVNLVDTYGFDSHALPSIAATAARVPGGEIRLLTQNQQPPGSAVAADYDGHATVVARRLGVHASAVDAAGWDPRPLPLDRGSCLARRAQFQPVRDGRLGGG